MDFGLIWGVARLGIGCALTWEIARRWAPLLSSSREGVERSLAVGVLAAWLVTLFVAGLGAVGQLGPHRLLFAAALSFAATLVLRPERPAPLLPRTGPERLALLWPALAVAPVLLWDIGWQLAAPPTDWDALTYHLYLPARWLQAAQLLHVPTVFGDPAAAFAPQNGALLFTWWMALLGGDAPTNVVNALPAVILALAVRGLATRCGMTPENATFAGVAVFWVGPMRSAIFEARVDAPMLAFWGASLFFIACALDTRRPPPWLAAGLATGLAAGSKVVGLALVGPQALLLAVLLLFRREPRACAGFVAACVAGGGWWFIVNLVEFGNPLFPLDLRLGGFALLSGAIPFDALAGHFHAPIGDLVGRVLPHFYGWATIGLTLLGFLGLMFSTLRAGAQRRVRVLTAAVGLYWALFYFLRMPHNTETRFLLPVVALALVGWAWLLEPLQRRGPWVLRSAWALCFAVLYLDIERLAQWRTALVSPVEAGVPLFPWIALVAATAVSVAIALTARTAAARRGAAAAGLLGIALAVGLGQRFSVESRSTHHAKSRFHEWAPAMQHVEHLDPRHELNVAYTGLNLPYALTGPQFARPVRYVNTQGTLEEGFYDFWQRDPRLFTRQKPGLYRGGGRDDYDHWARNLEAAKIDLLVIFRLHRGERYIATDEDGFPVERMWAMRHPTRFDPVVSDPAFELYRVRTSAEGTRENAP